MDIANRAELFEAFLNKHDSVAWQAALRKLVPEIHEVDRAATQIWFHFYPLDLSRIIERADDVAELEQNLQLRGHYVLKDQIDTSHGFFYGHRYWPAVKSAIAAHASASSAPATLDLASQIIEVAAHVSSDMGVDRSVIAGITAVGFMTLQQVGFRAFSSPAQETTRAIIGTPQQIIRRRLRDDSQGLFGFLRGDMKRYTVVFDERERDARFKLINTQHITTAAAQDKRDYHSRDPRCIVGEGPIPVECRSASCGTCWIGILAGHNNLSDVAALESRRIKEFGYINTDEPRPLIRLACQAQAFGNVTIVIPPWNGVFGKAVGYSVMGKQAAAAQQSDE
jgi:ferredoxin